MPNQLVVATIITRVSLLLDSIENWEQSWVETHVNLLHEMEMNNKQDFKSAHELINLLVKVVQTLELPDSLTNEKDT